MTIMRLVLLLLFATASAMIRGQATLNFTDPELLSLSNGGGANKGKLVRLIYGQDGHFQKTLICVYGDFAGPDIWEYDGTVRPARDIFVTRSTDDGRTWSAPINLSNTANLSSMNADHDGLPDTPAVPYYGDSEKPNIFSAGKTVVISWVDKYCPTEVQRTVVYPDFGLIEVPYSAVYVIRSLDAGATWSAPERLTDGYRDAKQDVTRAISNGWSMIVWQEDPQGLQPGDAEGPGDGGSGATVSKGTDIWFTSLSVEHANRGLPFPPPQRLTDNFTMMGQGANAGYEYGNTGASRPNLAVVGDLAIIAYEETKGLEGLDDGKYVRYHVFSAFDASLPDPTNGAGWIISNPVQNARRVRLVAQASPGPTTGVQLFIFFKQGDHDQGGPSDIMGRLGINGLMAPDLAPAVDPNCTVRENAMNNLPSMNFSSVEGLTAPSGANDFEDARAHRGLMRGDFIAVGYSWTPDWAVARFTDQENYNFYLRRSFDGGATWDAARNLSNLTDPAVTVLEPRLVGTPKSPDPNEPQDPNVYYVAWGTEVNQYEHLAEERIELDLFVARTADLGDAYSPVQAFADGPAGQFESQLRVSPDGRELFAVWQEKTDTGWVDTYFRSARVGQEIVGADVDGDGWATVLDFTVVLNNFGACAGCPADLNQDQFVDMFDLLGGLPFWSR